MCSKIALADSTVAHKTPQGSAISLVFSHMSSQEKPKSGSLWSNALLLLASLAIAGLFAEGIIRLVLGQNIILFPRFHTSATYGDYTLRRMTPNRAFTHTSSDGSWDFYINNKGFRDHADYAYDKPDGEFRVLVLGDSHTQGYEVSQDAVFSEVIERLLRRNDIDAAVLNTGVSGFSSAEALAFFEHEGVRYDPDAVVLAFFANDFEDNVKAGLYRLENDALTAVKFTHIPGVRILNIIDHIPGTAWLSQNSYLYSLGLNTARETAKRILRDRKVAELQTEYAISTTETVTAEIQALTVAIVEQISKLCKERDIPFIIIEIPSASDDLFDFKPSIPAELMPTFAALADHFIPAQNVLDIYRGGAQFHAPNGHRHISEFTHAILGHAVARYFLDQ